VCNRATLLVNDDGLSARRSTTIPSFAGKPLSIIPVISSPTYKGFSGAPGMK